MRGFVLLSGALGSPGHVVSIYFGALFWCSGALYRPDLVLTALDCTLFPASGYSARVGAQLPRGVASIAHFSPIHDLAVLRLTTRLSAASLTLGRYRPRLGPPVIYGWGCFDVRTPPQRLASTRLAVREAGECSRGAYTPPPHLAICATLLTMGARFPGDLGSPVFQNGSLIGMLLHISKTPTPVYYIFNTFPYRRFVSAFS